MPRRRNDRQPETAPDFQGFFMDVMRHTNVEPTTQDGTMDGITLTLSPDYDGKKVLDYYVKAWGIERWTPLLLGKALVDLKQRIGGAARLVATGEDFLEIYTTKCEFGEPRDSTYRGNLCSTCGSVSSCIALTSGITDPTSPNELRSTLAAGDSGCDLLISLAKA